MIDLTASKDFLQQRVQPWMARLACELDPALLLPTLLGGIYLKLTELAASQQEGTFFDIVPVSVAVGTASVLLEPDTRGRVRDVSVWIDGATGGPLPTIRISKDASGSGGGGIRVTPGQVNELGKVPPNTKLYVSSTAAINLYVIVRS